MSNLLGFFIGLILGSIITWSYFYITDKLNLIKLGYSGSAWLIRFLYKNIKKKRDNYGIQSKN
jgi:hypothetical protein